MVTTKIRRSDLARLLSCNGAIVVVRQFQFCRGFCISAFQKAGQIFLH